MGPVILKYDYKICMNVLLLEGSDLAVDIYLWQIYIFDSLYYNSVSLIAANKCTQLCESYCNIVKTQSLSH
jgi:hypothetical protein